MSKDYKYTLVIDLDEILIHYEDINQEEGQMKIRPMAEDFIQEMSKYFEIVIFTTEDPQYSEWAISYFEEPASKCINYLLDHRHL